MSNALGVDQIFDFARFSLNTKHLESVNYPRYSQKLFKIVVLVIMSICADSLVFLKFLLTFNELLMRNCKEVKIPFQYRKHV